MSDPLRDAFAEWAAAPQGDEALAAWKCIATEARHIGLPQKGVALLLRLRERYPDIKETY